MNSTNPWLCKGKWYPDEAQHDPNNHQVASIFQFCLSYIDISHFKEKSRKAASSHELEAMCLRGFQCCHAAWLVFCLVHDFASQTVINLCFYQTVLVLIHVMSRVDTLISRGAPARMYKAMISVSLMDKDVHVTFSIDFRPWTATQKSSASEPHSTDSRYSL